MLRLFFTALLLISPFQLSIGQNKKPLEIQDLATWKNISDMLISNDGKWVSYEVTAEEGNPTTFLYSAHRSRIHVSDITVDVKTETDFVDGIERVVSGRMKVAVWTDGVDKAKIEKVFEMARTHCTVTNAVNFPLDFELKIKD